MGSLRAKNEQALGHGSQEEAQSYPALPPLNDVYLPRVLQYQNFPLQGWATIVYHSPTDALYTSAQRLLQACKAFFDLPLEHKQRYQTQHKSEEGWASVEGEKEFITIRKLDTTPDELKSAALEYWAQAGEFLNDILGCIAQSLGLPADALTVYSEPCLELGHEKFATMLRMFKYVGTEGLQSKIVAEEHKDLGLLTLVFSDRPGLEVWDTHSRTEIPLEKNFDQPAASVLVGCQLERLSNDRYCGGSHLVRSYPAIDADSKDTRDSQDCRYSIVFALRAHSPVPIDTDALTTTITGYFEKPMKGVTANDLFRSIEKAHVNINAERQVRELQRRKLNGIIA